MVSRTPARTGLYAPWLHFVVFRTTIVLGMVMILLVFGTLAISRAKPLPQVLALPQRYLPGSIALDSMHCPSSEDVRDPSFEGLCWIIFQGHEVFFEFDRPAQRIRHAIIPIEGYELGQFIVSWGKPRGVQRNPFTVYVYWPTRWVIINGQQLSPYSRVRTVMYTLDQPPSSPWRGFRPGWL